ncbi:PepSY-associated TM helix domain-containing protein [Caulobacter segnis]|uniref:PepSY-associated TM helix domain-containing protein n=1 Tax=Caulobacter segnis TaxID=88688 RepID=UPI00240F679E|nr:PepSY-associated TM helix domain-containing protein [Caulobacter segnis]MDG2521951.1 PepSY-associated TM helix domain-containing protein [Caulobacter segnis]
MSDAPRKAGKPIWPKIPAAFVRAVLAGHSSLGLAFAALIYLVCFSGSVAVFAREFQRWETPRAAPMRNVSPEAVQTAAYAAIAKVHEVEHVYINLPRRDLPRLVLTVDGEGPNRTFFADADGRLIDTPDPVWTNFMMKLHADLHLPRTIGDFLVGMVGVALLSSLISGVLAHPRIFKDAFHLRWGGSKRLQEADLHNRLGVWAMPFHVLVSTTGALLGLTTIIVGALALAVFQGDMDKAYALFLPPHPKDDPRPAITQPLIVKAMEESIKRAPGGRLAYVGLEHPLERGAGITVLVNHPKLMADSDSFAFDGQARLLEAEHLSKANLGEKILGSVSVLHFGWFGGGAVKIAYGLLGLALCAVTSSGVAIWLARRRDKGRPAPRWERLWIAAVWSQPLAFAGSGLVVLLPMVPASPAVAIGSWLGLTIVVGLMTAWISADALSRGLRLGSGALMLAVAALWIARHAAAAVDPMGWIMTAAIAALGAALILTVGLKKTKAAAA